MDESYAMNDGPYADDFYRGDVILLVSVVKFRNRVEHVIDNYRR